jgi:hypothetical protein
MVFRFTKNAIKKLKLPKLSTVEKSNNLLNGWFVNVFYTKKRYKYFITTNAKTLFSVIIHGRSVVDDNVFFKDLFYSLRELLINNDCEYFYKRFIEPNIYQITLSNTNDRSIIGSMNDLIINAKVALDYHKLSPYDASKYINEAPMGLINMSSPGRYIKEMTIT